MGGRGSGRHWRYATRSTTGEYNSLDVRKLQRDGVLKPGYSCNWAWYRSGKEISSIGVRSTSSSVILSYRSKAGDVDWQDMEYPVPIEWTSCNFGGQRAWFRCPAVGCGRRVAILYSGKVFACRHCYNLAYESQRESAADLFARKADKIRRRLGWQPGILNPNGWKPKGMHWRTFETLRVQHDTMVNVALEGFARKLRLFER